LLGLKALEMAMEAEAHLLVEGFVAEELAVGLGGGEGFVDGEFVEALGGEILLFFELDAADAGQLTLGVFEFGGEKSLAGHGLWLLGAVGADAPVEA